MPYSAQDEAQIQESLRIRYASKKIEEQVIFDSNCDALKAHLKTREVSMNDGAGFKLQYFGRASGQQGGNRKFSLATGGKIGASSITLVTRDIEQRFGFTRNALQDAMDGSGTAGGYDLAKRTIDMNLRLIGNKVGQLLESDGFGTLGFVSSVGSTTTFTIGDAAAVPNKSRTARFYKGQVLNFAAAAMTGEIRSSAASEATIYQHTVSDVDRTTGVITVSANLTTSGVTAGDAVSEYGMRVFDATGNTSGSVFFGLDAWAPTTAIGSGDPLGRNGKPELQPLLYDVSAYSVTDALAELDQLAFDNGIPVGSKLFVPSKVHKILQLAAVAGQVVQMKDAGVVREGSDGEKRKIGYGGFIYQGMRGPVEIIPSAHTAVARWFDPDIFRFAHVGDGMINVHRPDGKSFRLNTEGVNDSNSELTSGYTGEIYARLQLLCDRPGDIIVAKGLGALGT